MQKSHVAYTSNNDCNFLFHDYDSSNARTSARTALGRQRKSIVIPGFGKGFGATSLVGNAGKERLAMCASWQILSRVWLQLGWSLTVLAMRGRISTHLLGLSSRPARTGHGWFNRGVPLMHQGRFLQFCHNPSPTLTLRTSDVIPMAHRLCSEPSQRWFPRNAFSQSMR